MQALDFKEHPFSGAISAINVANIMHRQCVNDYTRKTTIPFPLMGYRMCNRFRVETEMVPFLQTIIEVC